MSLCIKSAWIFFVIVLISEVVVATNFSPKEVLNVAPTITASGNQVYCPQTTMKIVTNVSITDPDDTGTDAIYIQITAGYVNGQDLLSLAGVHPNITTQWLPTEGKLKLYNPAGNPVLYTEFVAAIKDVTFYNSSASPSGIRNFSISIGQANYLPSNGHYYYYIPSLGITWTDAKVAAAASTYNGLQGYLATITAADEAQLAGAQASGAGWIGGSDAEIEGIWKWMTGPEAGSNFTFTYWNNGEPNNLNDEDYAHITAPGVGLLGSWNDLSNTGSVSGDYQPKGYVVEYGGMPGDPVIQIAASTSFTIAEITNIVAASRCGSGTLNLQATASAGTVEWYNLATGGAVIATGNNFTTPTIATTTTYYVKTSCGLIRTPIIATVNAIPTISSTNTPVARCGAGPVTLQANATDGTISWYTSASGGTSIGTGNTLNIANVTQNTIYYAEVNNNGCIQSARTPVVIVINQIPVITNQELTLCQSGTVVLDAYLLGMTYLWSTGATTRTISVGSPGVYTVDITNTSNCTARKTITVMEHVVPVIDQILVNDTTITIELTNPQNYFEYSIDGINYQSSNEFYQVPNGHHVAYVREIHLCSLATQDFTVFNIPNFFTPNNDSFNDVWEIKGLSDYPKAEIKIFNRFGNFIALLNNSFPSWNGNLNGLPLPASDYWYVLKIDDETPEIRGHFTLKR